MIERNITVEDELDLLFYKYWKEILMYNFYGSAEMCKHLYQTIKSIDYFVIEKIPKINNELDYHFTKFANEFSIYGSGERFLINLKINKKDSFNFNYFIKIIKKDYTKALSELLKTDVEVTLNNKLIKESNYYKKALLLNAI